jgi:hypothetical protein
MRSTELPAQFHSRDHLWTGHNGDCKQLNGMCARKFIQSARRLRIEISIDNRILLFAFQHGGDRENCKRESPVLRLPRARMQQDNH